MSGRVPQKTQSVPCLEDAKQGQEEGECPAENARFGPARRYACNVHDDDSCLPTVYSYNVVYMFAVHMNSVYKTPCGTYVRT